MTHQQQPNNPQNELPFDRFLHSLSQYSYKNGDSSCTYISIEACLRFMIGDDIEKFYMYRDCDSLRRIIEDIIVCGVAIDRGLGQRSCDETIKADPRLNSSIVLEHQYLAELKQPSPRHQQQQLHNNNSTSTYGQLLREMECMARGEQAEKRNYKVCCVLTKPPETICVAHVHNPNLLFQYLIFDSHPRGNTHQLEREGILKPNGNIGPGSGAGFYFFRNLQAVERYLERVLPGLDSMDQSLYGGRNSYNTFAHSMFEANIIRLKMMGDDRSPVMHFLSPPPELETNRPVLLETHSESSDTLLTNQPKQSSSTTHFLDLTR